jgi:(p)ppGpp synthase/HD superfamily hydrolase
MMKVELGDRFQSALLYAVQLHSRQVRKGKDTPYIAHLLAVTSLVLEDGGDEDQAIAALLHDAVEDQGGYQTLEEIRSHYGEHVAMIVAACSDSFTQPKPPWRQRKQTYLEHLPSMPPEVVRVSLADKLHNARTTTLDVRQDGETVWKRFRGGKEGTLWYYHALAQVFPHLTNSPQCTEFVRVVAEMESLAANTE